MFIFWSAGFIWICVYLPLIQVCFVKFACENIYELMNLVVFIDEIATRYILMNDLCLVIVYEWFCEVLECFMICNHWVWYLDVCCRLPFKNDMYVSWMVLCSWCSISIKACS